jgi:hypothetical protein
LLQWPIDEIESLRRNEINHQGLELKKGDLFEIKGTDTLQVVSLTPTCLLGDPDKSFTTKSVMRVKTAVF